MARYRVTEQTETGGTHKAGGSWIAKDGDQVQRIKDRRREIHPKGSTISFTVEAI